MTYSVDLILWPELTSQGHPIYLRITIDRKQRYISTNFHIDKKHWHPATQSVTKGQDNYKTINTAISTRKAEILSYIVKQEVNKISVTAQQVKDHFTGHDQHNLFTFLETFIKEVKNKREPGTLENYRKHLLKLEQFHGSQNLTFEQITPEFLLSYETYLRADVGNNYITALWKTLKTIFNAAIKKGLVTYYPFNQYENPVYVAKGKDYLTLAELDKIELLAEESKDLIVKQTAIYFLLGAYSGLRISDWYHFDLKTHVKDNRLYLRAQKNKEWVTMPLSNRLARNLKRIALVPLTIEEPTINRTLKEIGKLIGTSKHLTSHVGRKSFAVTMCAERGISSEVCATLMGITIPVCVQNYYEITPNKIEKEVLKAWEDI